tara:strand:+ start:1873 stop:2088 length:216 start_codon:yes stop_codon:yes gene_type:complete
MTIHQHNHICTPSAKIKVAKNVFVATQFSEHDVNYVRVTKKALKDEIKYAFNLELDNDKFVLRDNLDLYIN